MPGAGKGSLVVTEDVAFSAGKGSTIVAQK